MNNCFWSKFKQNDKMFRHLRFKNVRSIHILALITTHYLYLLVSIGDYLFTSVRLFAYLAYYEKKNKLNELNET